MASWQELIALLPSLSESPDELVWHHSASGRFFVKPLYDKLIPGRIDDRFKGLWQARIPLKIRIFLWQAIRRKLPASDQIVKWHGNAIRLALFVQRWKTSHYLQMLPGLVWVELRPLLVKLHLEPSGFNDLFDLTHNLSGHLDD